MFLGSSLQPLAAQPVIIGSGIAGLTLALELSRHQPVVVLSRGALSAMTSSGWAQGGIAAAMGSDDSPALHAEDTMKAGAGLCDPKIVKLVCDAAPDAIRWLEQQGVLFDKNLGLEGGHCRRRIVHATGDGTGAAIMKVLAEQVRERSAITVFEGAEAVTIQNGVGFMYDGAFQTIATDTIVLATGGAGALWQHTTNPLSSWGQGLALAARAGARLRDMEFMQFHPTAIAIGADPMPLASEALRGEGAVLVDERGERFMSMLFQQERDDSSPLEGEVRWGGAPLGANSDSVHSVALPPPQPSPQGGGSPELAPRDVVTRAIWVHLQSGHRVFLDARKIENFPARFPAIYDFCRAAKIDPVLQPIPIHPAAHYHMGGVEVDDGGRSSIRGLWAVGEVASTGLHGANRLASNSLLEAVVFARRMAEAIRDQRREVREGKVTDLLPHIQNTSPKIRAIMSAYVGVLRDETGLQKAVAALTPLSEQSDLALVALLIAQAALRREGSVGAHTRTDFPVERKNDHAA